MSFLTTSPHVFLSLPLGFLPSTSRCIHFFTQFVSSLLSTWPLHLNLPLRIVTFTDSIPNLFLSSSLLTLSRNFDPHIHLSICISVLCSLCSCSAFTAQVSLPYSNVLLTHVLYTLPLTFKDRLFLVSIGPSSLNLLQAFLILDPLHYFHRML